MESPVIPVPPADDPPKHPELKQIIKQQKSEQELDEI